MVLEIKKFNEKVLRKKAKIVENVDKDIEALVSNMIETMNENDGAGLAAPQVGVSKQVIVLRADLQGQQILSLINPIIIKKGKEKIIGEEGCLSYPEIVLNIKRFKEIEVEAMNIGEEVVRFKASGLLARVLQHEIDHINGLPFFNRLGIIDKIKFKFKHFSLKF